MSAASAVAAAKANLVTALATRWAAQPVLVTYGAPVDEPDELVQIGDTAFVATGKAPLSPLRKRDYMFTIEGIVSVSYGGGLEVQQEVTERALWFVGDLSDYLQDSGTSPSTQISLGGAVLWARVTNAVIHESDGLTDEDDITDGRTTAVAFTITGLIRA
jgi:hypothetical protein